MYIEGLKTGFMWLAAYPGLSFHENKRVYLFLTKNVVSVIFFIVAASWGLTATYFSIVDYNQHKFLERFHTASLYLLAESRILLFYMKRKQIRCCLEILRPNFLKSMNHNLQKHFEIYWSGIKECNTLYIVVSWLLHGCLVFWVIMSLVMFVIGIVSKYSSYSSGSGSVDLPSNPSLSNGISMPNLTFLLEFLALFVELEISLLVQLTFLHTVSMACSQIRILSSSLSSVTYSNDNKRAHRRQKKTENTRALILGGQLADCIQDHERIIRLVDSLQSSYSSIFDVQLIIVFVQTVVVGFYYIKAVTLNDYLLCMSVGFPLSLNIMTLCWKTTKLMQLSTDIANAAYEADWINSSAAMKTAVQMIAMRSQRPLKLTGIMGLVTLNYETAVELLRLAYSYFTLMKFLATKE